MPHKPSFLFVCGRNKRRSRTAEHIFRRDERFQVRSVGLSPSSERRISHNDLQWADVVFVMEAEQRNHIRDRFADMDIPPIHILYIEDEYEFMDEELVSMLRQRMIEHFG